MIPDSDVKMMLERYSYLRKRNYIPKSEFHITIIGNKNGEKIKESIAHLEPENKEQLLGRIERLISNTKWEDYSLLDIACKVSKDYSYSDVIDKRDAIIQMASVNKIKDFYDKLSLILLITLEYPFEHVTLMTRGLGEKFMLGIGIESETDFHKMDRDWL